MTATAATEMYKIKQVCPRMFQINWVVHAFGKESNFTQTIHHGSSRSYVLNCRLTTAKDAQCKITLSTEYANPLHVKSTTKHQTDVSYDKKPIGFLAQNLPASVGENEEIKGVYGEYERVATNPFSEKPEMRIGFEARTLSFRKDKNIWESESFSIVGLQPNDDTSPSIRVEIQIWLKFKLRKNEQRLAVEDFLRLFTEQTYCDVHFLLKSGKQIGAHKLLLCARSPIFETIFKQKRNESTTETVELSDVEEEIFREFLHFLYAGRTSRAMSDDSAQCLYELADKYDIGSLQEHCVSHMIANIHMANFMSMLNFSTLHKIQDVREACVECLLSNIRASNVIHLLTLSQLHNIPRLKEAVMNSAPQLGKEVVNSAEWVEFVEKYPKLSVEFTRKAIF